MPDAVGTKEKSLLHRSCQEGSVAEDVEDVFGCRNEERFSLYDVDAVDVRFALRVLCRKKLLRKNARALAYIKKNCTSVLPSIIVGAHRKYVRILRDI